MDYRHTVLQEAAKNALHTMTLPKAIELLQEANSKHFGPSNSDFHDALQVALFIMQLYKRGDFTYEPLP